MEKYIKKIRVWSNTGLIGSLVVVIIAILFKYLSPMVFRQSDVVYRNLTLACAVFAILDMIVILRNNKKMKKDLAVLSNLESKLDGYSQMVQTNSLCTLISTTIVSVIIILLGNFNLLMLAMMQVLMLFFTYPNMYKIKVELNLSDEEMRKLFKDQYIADNDTESNTPSKSKEND